MGIFIIAMSAFAPYCIANETENGLADMEAILGFADKKIVLLPMEGCEQAFINAGYTIVAPEEFNINMVK